MSVEEIPQGEHKEPRQIVQGGIKGRKTHPMGIKQRIYPQLKQIKGYRIPY